MIWNDIIVIDEVGDCMPYHDFLIYKKKPNYFTHFGRLYKKSFSMIRIDDDDIKNINFSSLSAYCCYYRRKNKYNGLCYYGITVIPLDSLKQFYKIMKNNNKKDKNGIGRFDELLNLICKADNNSNYIIHYGI